MKRISLLFFWCMARTRHSNGFNNNIFSHNSQRTILSSKTSGPEEYDDGIGNPDSQAKDGEALAKDFYDQLRKREQDLKKTKGESGSAAGSGREDSESDSEGGAGSASDVGGMGAPDPYLPPKTGPGAVKKHIGPRALAFSINSPGGSPAQSELLYRIV